MYHCVSDAFKAIWCNVCEGDKGDLGVQVPWDLSPFKLQTSSSESAIHSILIF